MKKILSNIVKPQNLVITLLVILIALLLGGFFYLKMMNRVFIDDSLIEAPLSAITPVSGGVLKKVYVYEGEKINKGDLIADVGDQQLRAQSGGVVVKVNNTPGSVISVTNPVAFIAQPDDFRVDGTIDENKGLDMLKIGQPVEFSVDAFPGKVYWGYLDEISPSAKQESLAFSISSERPTQQFDVFAKFDPNRYPELKIGMSAKMIVFTNLNNQEKIAY